MQSVPNFRALSLLLVLSLLFAAPLPVDARPFESLQMQATADPIRLLLEWLDGLWGDNGCSFDPNGGCRDTSETDGLDAGCTFDPNGLCHDAEAAGRRESLDNGCTMDPSGAGCRESVDNGCTADPDGTPCRNYR